MSAAWRCGATCTRSPYMASWSSLCGGRWRKAGSREKPRDVCYPAIPRVVPPQSRAAHDPHHALIRVAAQELRERNIDVVVVQPLRERLRGARGAKAVVDHVALDPPVE